MVAYLQAYSVQGYRDVDQDPQQDIIVIEGLDTDTDLVVTVTASADAGTMEDNDIDAALTAAGYTQTPP